MTFGARTAGEVPLYRNLPLLAIVLQFLVSDTSTNPFVSALHLRRSMTRALQLKTTEYNVLLHLSLEYVNDTFAAEFEDRKSDTVNHFCDSVNSQAGGNQVARSAEENGVSIETRIVGTSSEPDYQCTVVYGGRIEGDNIDTMPASGLYPYGTTVEQIVYVTANRTLSLGSVSSMVQSGFNRGRGGRVRFRSLLRDHPMFATVENVEVVQGALTRYPTSRPSRSPSSIPTGIPSTMPTAGPSQPPTLGPTSLETRSPSIPPVPITPKPTQPLTLPPTEQPSNDENPPVFSAVPVNDGDAADSPSIDPLAVGFIAAGSLLVLIAAFCVLCLCYESRNKKKQKDDPNGATPTLRNRMQTPSNTNMPNDGNVPDMVQLDDDNRSLANTTLGDRTAGGHRTRPQPWRKSVHAESPRNGRSQDSFDDNSLYTSHLSVPGAPPSAELADNSTNESGGSSNYAASSNSNSVMLPPSVMPYEDESIMFPIQDFNSDTTSTESGAIQSSILSESFASSLAASDTNRGPVDVDAIDSSSQEEDLFGQNPFLPIQDAIGVTGQRKKKKLIVIENAKLTSQAKQGHKEDAQTSRFSPFETSETSLLKHIKSKPSGGATSSFRSLEDAEPSVASSTSSLTKKVENLFMFGFQSPPEDHKSQDSSSTPPNEEEKREIECETRDDERSDGGLMGSFQRSSRDGEKMPFPLDLLADHQQLERPASPASWSSWNQEARSKDSTREESKRAPKTDLDAGRSHRPLYRNQILGGSGSLAGAGLRHFLPTPEGETKEASPTPNQNAAATGKEDVVSTNETAILPPASSGPSSPPIEDGTGILGVQPRKESDALVENRSVSSSSTGLSNPWLWDAVEQTLGPRSVTADIESLSGRSNRSGKSHRSRSSHQSHRSHKSNRSYNVPSSSKYKGRGDGRIRSAAASVASYGGSSAFDRKSADTAPPIAPRTLEHDLNRLEMQLAALQTETDQVTASSITLSSMGAKTRSTLSSKLTHTGAKINIKRRVIVEVPPGKLGVILANRHNRLGTVVSEVRPDSSLKGMLSPGDKLVAIDGEDVQGMNVNEITEIMSKKQNSERLLTVITSMHQEPKSVGTL